MSVLLRAENLSHQYGGRLVLNIDSFRVKKGETLCLMGPNGAGKSTLVRVLNLVEDPGSGIVWFENEKVGTRSCRARRRMAGVFQRPHMFRGSVAENVAYGLKLRKVSKEEIGRRVEAMLRELSISHLAGHEARKLSGGEAQRVALARAIVIKPDVLFLDEPASFLDSYARQEFHRDLHRVACQGQTTVVYVTHSVDEARLVADRVALLEDGRLKRIGPAPEVLAAFASEVIERSA